jgi:hypothetical protein
MAAVFCLVLIVYYVTILRNCASDLARLLWFTYFALGCSALFIQTTEVLQSIFSPNYPAALYLVFSILIGVTGFLNFRTHDVRDIIVTVRGRGFIEACLIALQFFSIAFFTPFAISSLGGDPNANRLDLGSTAQVLASYGVINTVAGMASHLFAASIVMAFIRLSQAKENGGSILRAAMLLVASLSYVIYIFAYVGRDGVVYWLMTAGAIFFIFRTQLPTALRLKVVTAGAVLGGLLLLPLATITIARFANSEFGTAWSVLEYFGSQINNFSDFSSISRPTTSGAMNFPVFKDAACVIARLGDCESWADIKGFIFDQYLTQGKAPWVFATYVSDFVADFGYSGTFTLLILYAVICHLACVGRDRHNRMTLARLLLIFFLFLGPYWGVFYFRFGIVNVFIIVNLVFVAFVWAVHKYAPIVSEK